MKVSEHAMKRWKERTGSKQSEEKAAEKILDLVASGEKVQLKKRFRVIALLNHRCEESEYVRATNGMIFVVANEVVVTIHNGVADRWERKGE